MFSNLQPNGNGNISTIISSNFSNKISKMEKIESEKFDICCNFISTNICREKSFPFLQYTEYKIILKTNKKKWEINKRYNDFDQLNSNLIKANIRNLPKLPQKAIFKSKDFISERKTKLQKYMTILLLRDDIYSIDLIFDFIELKKEEYLLMRSNLEDMETCPNSPYSSSSTSTKASTFKFLCDQKQKEETVIDNDFFYANFNLNEESIKYENEGVKTKISDFLTELNSKGNNNKSLTIQKFRDCLFDNLRKKTPGFYLQNEDIYKLLFGDRSSRKFGLVFHCGDLKKNKFGSEKCVEFLSNLLDYEYNMDSENFGAILRIGKLDIFKQMGLKNHLTADKPNLFSSCCKIISLILNEEKKITIKALLDNNEELEEKVENFITARSVIDF